MNKATIVLGQIVIDECEMLSLFTKQMVNERHDELLREAEQKEPPEIRLNVEVIEAKELQPKDPNGMSDPFVTMYIASAPTHRYNTSVKSGTLNPMWEEHFSLWVHDFDQNIWKSKFNVSLIIHYHYPHLKANQWKSEWRELSCRGMGFWSSRDCWRENDQVLWCKRRQRIQEADERDCGDRFDGQTRQWADRA